MCRVYTVWILMPPCPLSVFRVYSAGLSARFFFVLIEFTGFTGFESSGSFSSGRPELGIVTPMSPSRDE